MKTLQVVAVGGKEYKFDPKTSMYYYEEPATDDLKKLERPEIKEFDGFVGFDVKKSKTDRCSALHTRFIFESCL